MSDCDHPSFVADVVVGRIQREESGPVVAYTADVKVKCEKCLAPFRFLGLPAGMSAAVPMTNVDGTELRAPIAPLGAEADTRLMGFTIRQGGAH